MRGALLYCVALLLLACANPAWGVGAAEAGEALLQTDQAMDRDIMEQGNDTRATLAVMDPGTVGLSYRRHVFVNPLGVYRQIPPGKSPSNHLTLYTEYAAVSADGEVGFTYGVWNSRYFEDSMRHKSDLYFSYLVFGFDSGLWTATWVPRGAPRVGHHEYLRIWRRGPGDLSWRLAGGTLAVERLTASDTPPTTAAVVLPAPTGRRVVPALAAAVALESDRALSDVGHTRGRLAAYTAFATDDIRVMGMFESTSVGVEDLRTAFVREDSPFKLQPVGTCAVSGDLVCSYGYYRLANDPDTGSPSGMYLHLWLPAAEESKLALAFLLPFKY